MGRRDGLGVLLLTLFLCLPSEAIAATVTLSAAPVLGRDAPAQDGWVGYLITVENASPEPVSGRVRLTSREPVSTEAAFSLTGLAETHVTLMTRTPYAMELSAEALDDRGARLAKIRVDSPGQGTPLILDLSRPSRVASLLEGTHLSVGYTPPPSLGLSAPALSVQSPFTDESGDPILPTTAALYGSVTLLIAPSDVLVDLGDREMAALSDYVLAGGSLAISPSRPEHLRTAPIANWVGGAATRVPPGDEVLTKRTFLLTGPDPSSPGAPPTVERLELGPDRVVASMLDGYSGGNLHPTRWGTRASYGLGEVHLLPFDVRSPDALADPWAGATLSDLTRHAWDRRAHIVMPLGLPVGDDYELRALLRLLDPNEGARWTVVTATILLVVYAIVVGPFVFRRARRRGTPLSVLWQIPLLSIVTMVTIVIIGLSSRGIRGRARHVSFVDAGAGMTRAVATRFRAFYAGRADEISVGALDGDAVLDVAGDSNTARKLTSAPSGPTLDDVVLRPWETALIREESFMNLGGGISVTELDDDVQITNRSTRALLGVLAVTPGKRELRFFDRIADGQSVLMRNGTRLPTLAPTTAGHLTPLPLFDIESSLERASRGLGETWSAIARIGQNADWLPVDVPVVIAQLDGGEGATRDSGLDLESDRVLVRVVGYGGLP